MSSDRSPDDGNTQCRTVDIDGAPVRLAGGTGDLSPEARAALAEVVRAAKARADAEPPELWERQEERLRALRRRAKAADHLPDLADYTETGDRS